MKSCIKLFIFFVLHIFPQSIHSMKQLAPTSEEFTPQQIELLRNIFESIKLPNITIINNNNINSEATLDATQTNEQASAMNASTQAIAQNSTDLENTQTTSTNQSLNNKNDNTNTNNVNIFTQFFNTITHNAPDNTISLKNFFIQNKKKIVFYSAATIYVGIYAHLLCENYYLKRSDLWASWRQEKQFEQLCIKTNNDLMHELLQDIQRIYIDAKQPDNFILPMTQFLGATDKEMLRIKRYLSITTWIKRFRLSFFFPISPQSLLLAQSRITRLSFVRHVFASWAAEYKMDMAIYKSHKKASTKNAEAF